MIYFSAVDDPLQWDGEKFFAPFMGERTDFERLSDALIESDMLRQIAVERAEHSRRVAAKLLPVMRRAQVHAIAPVRRPIRGAVPRKFSFYQGAA